ncbi:MAG TPA: DUF6438 domain-containing protein [Allosphingosinicella sp.]|jgi:hypothetical protein|nr:DUF6438 domain-containing protein [Allosphingosinicella sp.]
MKKIAILIAAALALPVAAAAPPRPATPVETIIFETGPCFGTCPVYRVTVNSNGTGTFEGRHHTAVTGTRPFRLRPGQYQAFARHLAPLRPARGTIRYAGERCRSTATDMPSAEVTWRSRRGTQGLYFYYGCDMRSNRAIAARLRAAPDLLPLAQLIGGRR